MTSDNADFSWLCEHSLELEEKYRGKWIAVHDGQVIGVGNTAVEADAQARLVCPDGGFILDAIDSHTDTLYASVRVA